MLECMALGLNARYSERCSPVSSASTVRDSTALHCLEYGR